MLQVGDKVKLKASEGWAVVYIGRTFRGGHGESFFEHRIVLENGRGSIASIVEEGYGHGDRHVDSEQYKYVEVREPVEPL